MTVQRIWLRRYLRLAVLEDYDDMRAERGTSFLDRRHRFTLACSYETPWYSHSQNRFLRSILGNYVLERDLHV